MHGENMKFIFTCFNTCETPYAFRSVCVRPASCAQTLPLAMCNTFTVTSKYSQHKHNVSILYVGFFIIFCYMFRPYWQSSW